MVDLPPNPIPQGPTMMTKLLGISVAALAATAGASILIIHDGSDTGKKLTVASVAPAATAPDRIASISAPGNPTDRIITKTGRTSIDKPGIPPVPPIPPLPPVTALEADAAVLLALDLKEDCLRQIATAIEQAPTAFGACSDNTPRPVMVTSANGRGHVIMKRGSIANANTLIPVAAKNGGDDVLMWFPPTQDFMKSLPDSLVKPLEEVLEMDIRITDDDGGHMTVRRKHLNDDGTLAETEDVIGLQDMKSMMKELDGKMNDPALAMHMQKLKDRLKLMMNDSSRIVFDRDSLPYRLHQLDTQIEDVDDTGLDVRIDSILGEMPERQMMVDSIMRNFPMMQLKIDSIMKNMPEMQFKMDSVMKEFPMRQRMFDSVMKLMPNSRIMIKRFGNDSAVDIELNVDSTMTTMPNSRIIVKRTQDAKPLQYKIDTRINVMDSTMKSSKSMHVRSRISVLRSPATRGGIILLSIRDVIDQPEAKTGGVTSLQETWRETNGAVETTGVFPNPTSDGGATMSFTLAEDRNVNISLHDLTGAKVLDLVRNSPRKAGTGQMAFTLPGITPGMYLVTLTTDRGERAVQRLIVQ